MHFAPLPVHGDAFVLTVIRHEFAGEDRCALPGSAAPELHRSATHTYLQVDPLYDLRELGEAELVHAVIAVLLSTDVFASLPLTLGRPAEIE